jgi:hypothetical protein
MTATVIVHKTFGVWEVTPVIPATQEAEVKASWFKATLGKQFERPYLEKAHHKKGLVEWLKV